MTAPKAPPAPPKPAAGKNATAAKPTPPPVATAKPPATLPDAQRLTGDSAKGTSNRALQLRRVLQNQDVDFAVPQGAKLFLHPEQVMLIQQATPANYIKSHSGRGGQQFKFVPIGLTIERLNMIFGYGWSFEVVDQGTVVIGEKIVSVWVRGFMEIVGADGTRLQRPAFGGSDVEYYQSGPKAGQPLSIADNFKGATSDAIGKAASAFGLWLDLYDKEGDILKERTLAAEQTEQLLNSATAQDASLRTVEGKATPIADPETGEIPMTGPFSGATDAAQAARMAASAAQVHADLQAAGLEQAEDRDYTEEEIGVDFDAQDNVPEAPPPADEAPARPPVRTAPPAPAAKAPPAPAPKAPPAAAKPAPAAAQPPHRAPTKAEMDALSAAFFTEAAAIGWKFPVGHPQAGQARAADIKAVLVARGFSGLNTDNKDQAIAALKDEAKKRRDAATARQQTQGARA